MKELGIEAIGMVCHAGKREDRLNMIKLTLNAFERIYYVVINAAITTHLGPML